MSDCFSGHQSESAQELKLRIKNCGMKHTYLKEIVKSGCARGHPDKLNSAAKEKVPVLLVQTVNAHRALEEFFRPYLETSATQEIYYEDKLDVLRQRNSKLKQDRTSYQKQFRDLASTDQQHQDTVQQLQKRNQDLEQEILGYKQGEVETTFKRRQQQLEETLKAQNELIEDLERRLSDSIREKEILRDLNKNLQVELQKNERPLDTNKARTETIEVPILPHSDIIINKATKPRLPEALEYNMLPVYSQQPIVESKIQDSHSIFYRIKVDLQLLAAKIAEFNGIKGDSEYVFIEDALARTIVKLNGIQSNGDQYFEDHRRSYIYEMQQLLNNLESKCTD